MDHTTLTAEQYARVVARLMEQGDYLHKLKERMRANRFPADDPLYAAVTKAWEAASHACVAACGWRNPVHGLPAEHADFARGQCANDRHSWAAHTFGCGNARSVARRSSTCDKGAG